MEGQRRGWPGPGGDGKEEDLCEVEEEEEEGVSEKQVDEQEAHHDHTDLWV